VTYPGSTSSVSHTYTTGGTFAVRVTAVDAFGNTSTGGTSILISARAQPVVSISTSNANPQAGTDITFTASVTPAPNSGTSIVDANIEWGDGTPRTFLGAVNSTNISVHHVYQLSGTYTVVLTATDSNGGVGTATTSVFVQAQTPLGVTLSASATTSGTNTIETFTATVTGLGNAVVISYLWEFGNGDAPQTTTTNQITHQYPHPVVPISYTVRVTVTTSNGQTATNTTVITP